MGSPAMNLIEGDLTNGVFSAQNIKVAGFDKKYDSKVTLGFRAEDAQLAQKDGELVAPVYSFELLGDASMVTVKAGGTIAQVKADKEYSADIGKTAHMRVPTEICHLFDTASGERIL